MENSIPRIYTRVTKRSHPAVFAAFREIDYDNGAVNRLEPERQYYDVPDPWIQTLRTSEQALASLTPEQLSTYCCGEFEESGELAASLSIPNSVSDFLNAYFNGWEKESDADPSGQEVPREEEEEVPSLGASIPEAGKHPDAATKKGNYIDDYIS